MVEARDTFVLPHASLLLRSKGAVIITERLQVACVRRPPCFFAFEFRGSFSQMAQGLLMSNQHVLRTSAIFEPRENPTGLHVFHSPSQVSYAISKAEVALLHLNLSTVWPQPQQYHPTWMIFGRHEKCMSVSDFAAGGAKRNAVTSWRRHWPDEPAHSYS